MTPRVVAREFFDDVVRQRDAAIARADAADERYAALVDEMVALKRHDIAAPLHGAAPVVDEFKIQFPHTQLAIDEAAGGDAELALYLDQRARKLAAAERAQHPNLDALDRHVAAVIRAGDQ